MSSELMKAARWIGVQLSIARGFLAWAFYRAWPHGRRGSWVDRIGLAVLPYAGDYAFADDPWVRECRYHWIKTGMPRPHDPSDSDPFFQASQGSETDGR